MMMRGVLVTARASEFWMSCRRCIWVESRLRKSPSLSLILSLSFSFLLPPRHVLRDRFPSNEIRDTLESNAIVHSMHFDGPRETNRHTDTHIYGHTQSHTDIQTDDKSDGYLESPRHRQSNRKGGTDLQTHNQTDEGPDTQTYGSIQERNADSFP